MSSIEVVVPVRQMDFDFNGGRSVSNLSAPSTPKGFGEYEFLSAPASPSKMSELYGYSCDFLEDDEERKEAKDVNFSICVPFEWEERPGVPKASTTTSRDEEFAFAFGSEQQTSALSSADELFDGGKIKTLKLPPSLKVDVNKDPWGRSLPSPSPRSPISKGKKIIQDVFSPRRKVDANLNEGVTERGRERTAGERRSSRRRESRSLSPLRVTGYPWQETAPEETAKLSSHRHAVVVDSMAIVSSTCTPSYAKSSTKKWSLKDLLLFRSASEGRSSDRDPLGKFSAASLLRNKKHPMDFQEPKTSSCRFADGSVSRRRAPISPHEMHYTINRAVSEDMKKKTFLPYKQGLLGGLAFNPAVQALSNRFGS